MDLVCTECPVCHHAEPKPLYDFPPSALVPAARALLERVRIYRCQACAMVFTNAVRFTAEQLASLYDAPMWDNPHWRDVSAATAAKSPDYPFYQSVLRDLGPGAGRSLIDIGCGLGVFLATAQQAGWAVSGTELSEYAADVVARQLDCTIHRGEVEALELPPESFDVVASWDLLEHVRDVPANLEAMHRLLKPGGTLLLRTINEDALVVQLTCALYRLTGGRVFGPVRRAHEIYHLHYFTTRTLARLVEEHGFRIERRILSDHSVQRLSLPRWMWPGMWFLYGLQGLTGRRFKQLLVATRLDAKGHQS